MEYLFQTDCGHPAAQLACRELSEKLSSFFGNPKIPSGGIRLKVRSPEDQEDDEYSIDVDFASWNGVIEACNPRALLFGAYRLLRELGFRWIRPGKNGDVIPTLPKILPHIRLADRPRHRFRGICIEGAVSRENVLETIRWMVKQGFNNYFIQFRDAYTFFARWYTHEENPLLTPEPFDEARAKALTEEVRREVHALGLELQMVGHGWTCEPFGIRGEGWYQSKQLISEETKSLLAEVKGKRELWGGIALNTNLCYGQEKVRKRLVDAIVEYARENPDVNLLHFWLADAANNHCECALCSVKRPADWYVEILNEADRCLTEAGLNTRIVFLVYCDLLWPAEHARLEHPERFVLMFAPITRSYSRNFSPEGERGGMSGIPPYLRNRIELPKSPGENLAFLSEWKKHFPGAGFDYDYHYMWDHFKDLGGMQIARILYEDCRNLKKIGLDGLVSCQTQRAFFPHGLGMAILGEVLWNPEKSFDEMAKDYFAAAYGRNGAKAQQYFEKVSEIFLPQALRGELNRVEFEKMLASLAQFEEAVCDIQPALQEGMEVSQPAWNKSWRELACHITLCRLTMNFLNACMNGENEAEEALAPMIEWARKHEEQLQGDFDVFEFVTTLRERVLPRVLKALLL